ncbi:MAG: glycosyltransferase family 25 protein [Bacteroidales bacterium]
MGIEKNIGIDHIYVVHAPKGYEEHERRLKKISQSTGFEFQIIVDDTLLSDASTRSKYFVKDIQELLGRGTVACTFNHIQYYELIIKNNDAIALILEDDVCFEKNFLERLQKIIQEAQTLEKGFIISIENSTLKFPSRKVIKKGKGKFLYPANFGRCAGAYLMDQAAARQIMKDLEKKKCDKPIDWWHRDLIANKVVRMYWAHPTVVEQGSLNGKMSASLGISSYKKSYLRQISWFVQKVYKLYIYRFFSNK